MLNKFIKFFLENRLVTFILLVLVILWGVVTAPFSWDTGWLPADPVPVDAIPDLGENQQIVYTEWPGRSPQDIEDQVTYPLTTSLLGISGVKTIRSNSIFGLSSIYIIFEEDKEFYWSRSRILEKLNALPEGTLPEGVSPALGPDATALGQVYWYTLEGRDPEGHPAGGWDPQELRSVQDFFVRYALTSVSGVAEVASIGGFVREYQVDIDPNSMKAYGVNINQVIEAVKNSNLDIGARTIEINRAEYLVRALGYVKSLEDLESSVVAVRENVPVRLGEVAMVTYGPANRRGGLDKDGVEAVGGVVVARYGENPLAVIQALKQKIQEVSTGLPAKTMPDGTVSRVTIVPFYDRTGLIYETLGTLEEALSLEILISIIVVIILVLNLRASVLISSLLPVGVLMTFIVMRYFGVDANIVALSGIAIAIGVMVDVGVVFTENIVRHLDAPENRHAGRRQLMPVIYEATTEVAPAVITALATTVVSFLPVFALEAAEGKLFRPLAFTKTFAMIAAFLIGIMFIPAMAQGVFSIRFDRKKLRIAANLVLVSAGTVLLILSGSWVAAVLIAVGLNNLSGFFWKRIPERFTNYTNVVLTLLVVVYYLTQLWMPMGAGNSFLVNFLFVLVIIATVLGILMTVVRYYTGILRWALAHKKAFLLIPILLIVGGITIWYGFTRTFAVVEKGFNTVGIQIEETSGWKELTRAFPGLGREFMPALDEGSFLLMPTTMPHSGVEENLEVIRMLDLKVSAIPEVESVVGKWGRVNSALDPAPISMFENVINYKSEYILDEKGKRLRFKTDREGRYLLKGGGVFDPGPDGLTGVSREELVRDKNGEYFRQWRPEIGSPDDIWKEILAASRIPGLTSAPKLQPIQTRLVMLQTGMRAPMGIKVYGPDLNAIAEAGLAMEAVLKKVEGVAPSSVFADRIVGKPYLELKIRREVIARYGLTVKGLQMAISSAIGGVGLSTTVEGRERFPIRVRYAREFRDDPESLKAILIPTPSGVQVPLGELVDITYSRGPQMIKSEDTFLVGYVIFDKQEGYAEVDVVEQARKELSASITNGELTLPEGVTYRFTGNYENQERAAGRLLVIIPLSFILIFLILYFQFRSVIMSTMVFSGVFVAFAGGFLMIWLYGQDWFLNFTVSGMPMRSLFQIHTINLSVAVWVGFIALFGVATDDGVIMGTYLKQVFARRKPETRSEIRESVVEAGSKRVRPAMMTAATTIIALIPVLTSTGKGSDIMVPMAIPLFGGMILQVMTMFVVPVLYCVWQESKLKEKVIV